jgi:4-hydroxy-tetrahydrodipicolinate reductase
MSTMATPAPSAPARGAVLRVCVAGVTGWVGRLVAEAVKEAADLEFVAGVARSDGASFSSVAEALDAVPADVVVDYTSATAVKRNTLAAIERGVGVVVGSSGLSAADYAEIDAQARKMQIGVIAAGNFSVTAALMIRFAAEAAQQLEEWEVIDYASAAKEDAPSGTSREVAERLQEVRTPELRVPIDEVHGAREARGASVAGTQVHSIRLPSFTVSTEILFAAEGERLSIRHDAGESAAPYIGGTLIAIRAVPARRGLTRGLDQLLGH